MSLPKKIPEEMGTLSSETILNTKPKLPRYNDSEYSDETYEED